MYIEKAYLHERNRVDEAQEMFENGRNFVEKIVEYLEKKGAL